MPTVILFDVSLSMSRWAGVGERNGYVKIKSLANQGVSTLVDYIGDNARYEYVAVMVFSALWEITSQFSRDHLEIKRDLPYTETYDKTNIVNALQGVLSLNLSEWSQLGPINLIIVTDGQIFKPNGELSSNDDDSSPIASNSEENYDNDIDIQSLNGAFKFPCRLQVVCLSSPFSPSLLYALPFYKKLISVVCKQSSWRDSQIWIPDELTLDAVQRLFRTMAEKFYEPYNVTISCGRLSSSAMLAPKLELVVPSTFPTSITQTVNNCRDITICGFVSINDISSPASVSRHSVYPTYSAKHDETEKARQILSREFSALPENVSSSKSSQYHFNRRQKLDEESEYPSFCAMLHNVLKSENMVALCRICEPDRYGPNPVPWLPPLDSLGIPDGLTTSEVFTDESTRDKHDLKSYSSNCVMWLEIGALQSDVQKMLRHARRLPDKNPHFFKELNRLRRAALSYGYYGFISSMADIIDRERLMMSAQENPNHEAISQLDHAATSLRQSLQLSDSYEAIIAPCPPITSG